MQPPHSWEATVEEFLVLQSILPHFQCWLDDTELQLSPEEADELIQKGCQGRQLSCMASVHVALPEDGLAVQVCTTASLCPLIHEKHVVAFVWRHKHRWSGRR